MKKRLLSVFLVLAMMLTMLPISALAAEYGDFSDLVAQPNAWYKNSVDWTLQNGFFVGATKTEFDPDGEITRGMFVTILNRYARSWYDEGDPNKAKPENTGSEFTDVADGQYYTGSVNWAKEKGIVVGRTTTTFAPNDPITRQEIAKILKKYVAWHQTEFGVTHVIDNPDATLEKFKDKDTIASWAKDDVLQCLKYGLVFGHDTGNYEPTGSTTRAQAAAMLYRLDWGMTVHFDFQLDDVDDVDVTVASPKNSPHCGLHCGHNDTLTAPDTEDVAPAGYSFDGWYDEDGNKFEPDNVTPGTTYYARWIIDYIYLAVTDSVDWVNKKDGPKDNVNDAVAALRDWLNAQWEDNEKIETDVVDTLKVKDVEFQEAEASESGNRTVVVTVEADAESDSMLALGEFAVRYAYGLIGNNKDLSTDIEDTKDLIKDMLTEVLAELRVTYTKADLDDIVNQLAQSYGKEFKSNFLNYNNKTCIDGMTAKVNGVPITNVDVPGVTTSDLKKAAKKAAVEIAKALHASAQEYSNGAWVGSEDKPLKMTATINVTFTPTTDIADSYESEGGEFPENYDIVLNVVAWSDYLEYMYGGGEGETTDPQDYVKVLVPTRVRDAYDNNFYRIEDAIYDSSLVQGQLTKISDKFTAEIVGEQDSMVPGASGLKMFNEVISALKALGMSDAEANAYLKGQLTTWLENNGLRAKDGGKIDIRNTFVIHRLDGETGPDAEPDNSNFYTMMGTLGETTYDAMKEALDKEVEVTLNQAQLIALAQKAADDTLAALKASLPPAAANMLPDSVTVTGVNPSTYSFKVNLWTGESSDEINLVATIDQNLSGSNQIPVSGDVQDYFATLGISGVESTIQACDPDNLVDTLKPLVDKYASYLTGNTDVQAMVALVSSLKDYEDKKDDILDVLYYVYADLIKACGGTVDDTDYATYEANMQKFVDDKIDEGIDALIGNLDEQYKLYKQLVAYIDKVRTFDQVWEQELGGVYNVLNNTYVKSIMTEDGFYDQYKGDIQNAIQDAIDLLEKYGGGRASKVTINLGGDDISVESLTSALTTLKTAAGTSYEEFVSAFGELLEDYDLTNLSLSAFEGETNAQITVAYGDIDWSFYLVLEREWNQAEAE